MLSQLSYIPVPAPTYFSTLGDTWSTGVTRELSGEVYVKHKTTWSSPGFPWWDNKAVHEIYKCTSKCTHTQTPMKEEVLFTPLPLISLKWQWSSSQNLQMQEQMYMHTHAPTKEEVLFIPPNPPLHKKRREMMSDLVTEKLRLGYTSVKHKLNWKETSRWTRYTVFLGHCSLWWLIFKTGKCSFYTFWYQLSSIKLLIFAFNICQLFQLLGA